MVLEMGRKSREVQIRDLKLGKGNPVIIQSMTNTETSDVKATVRQILDLEEAGCELVRMTINTKEAAMAIPAIKERVHIPLVADIHFDYRLALLAMENGIDKLRINPGNIGSEDKIFLVVEKAKEKSLRQQAQRDGQHDRQQQRRAHQPQRGRNAFADHLQHRAVVNQRIAEIAPQDVLQPHNVLRDQRLIQPQALANTFDIFRSHARCDVRRHRIAGRELDQQKRHQRNKEQHRQQLQQPTREKCVHDVPLPRPRPDGRGNYLFLIDF